MSDTPHYFPTVVGTLTANSLLSADVRAVTIRFPLPAGMRFFPGQYAQITIPSASGDAERLFSVAQSAQIADGMTCTFLTNVVPNGLASSFFSSAAVGTQITARFANHGWRIPDHTARLLLVGSGVGIAPFLSLLAARADISADARPPLTLAVGTRLPEDRILEKTVREAIANDSAASIAYISGVEPTWHAVNAACADALLAAQPTAEDFFVLCGHKSTVEHCREQLLVSGIPATRIYFEIFSPL